MQNSTHRRDAETQRQRGASIPYAASALALAGMLSAAVLRGESWRMQYFYDEEKSSLVLNDLKFPSPRRGVAVGFIDERGKRPKPTAVVTADGGAHWSLVPTHEVGVSLYFLNETVGWMVTDRGLWRTSEAGRNWQKLSKTPKGLFRVHFLDEKHGFGVGLKKLMVETHDGGDHWTPVPAAAEPDTTPAYTSYTWISFATPQHGIVTGWSQPPRRGRERNFPDWMDPEAATSRAETPHLFLTIETHDGGKTWRPTTTSGFGRITRIRYSSLGVGLGLVEFSKSFAYPSEVYRVIMGTGKSDRVYREKNRRITDVWPTNTGTAYLAGVDSAGELLNNPIPGKLRMLRSADMKLWSEMEVDYRAVAGRATLAVVDDENAWVATDTGMILKLVR